MSYTVHLTTDKPQIEAFLRRDPTYAAYALGDLEPVQFAFCTWYVAEAAGQTDALVLLYRRLDPPVLLTMGAAKGIAAIFDEVDLPDHVAMAAEMAHLAVFEAHYDFGGDRVRSMLRMKVGPEAFLSVREQHNSLSLRRLDSTDVPAIEALYATGGSLSPDAFSAAQVAEGVFFGLEQLVLNSSERGILLAVAGTHLVAPTMGMAAVGNVFTHPSYRCQGFGRLVTSAVTEELLRRKLQVVLNVDADNAAAVHLYERLGYQVHCPFFEGFGRQWTEVRG